MGGRCTWFLVVYLATCSSGFPLDLCLSNRFCGMLQHSHWQTSHLFQKEPPPGRKCLTMWQPGRLIKQTICVFISARRDRPPQFVGPRWKLPVINELLTLFPSKPTSLRFSRLSVQLASGNQEGEPGFVGLFTCRVVSRDLCSQARSERPCLTCQTGPRANLKHPVMQPFKNIQVSQGKECPCFLLSIQEFSWLASDGS